MMCGIVPSTKEAVGGYGMNIWVENFIDARAFRPTEPTLAIRIFNPGAAKKAGKPSKKMKEWPDCPQAPFSSELYKAVYDYSFEDVDYDEYEDSERLALFQSPKCMPYTANIADDLVRKFFREKNQVAALLVQGHVGASRSVAIAHALDEGFELGATWLGSAAKYKAARFASYSGNNYVYRLTCEAIDRLVSR